MCVFVLYIKTEMVVRKETELLSNVQSGKLHHFQGKLMSIPVKVYRGSQMLKANRHRVSYYNNQSITIEIK